MNDKLMKEVKAQVIKDYQKMLLEKVFRNMDIDKYIEVDFARNIVRVNKQSLFNALKSEIEKQMKAFKVDLKAKVIK